MFHTLDRGPESSFKLVWPLASQMYFVFAFTAILQIDHSVFPGLLGFLVSNLASPLSPPHSFA